MKLGNAPIDQHCEQLKQYKIELSSVDCAGSYSQSNARARKFAFTKRVDLVN